MTQPRPPSSLAGPRWYTLLALSAGVLALHLILLADGLPPWAGIAPSATVTTAQTTEPAAARTPAQTGASAAAPRSSPVHVSSVRWIVPPPPIPPAPPPEAKKSAPRPPAKPRKPTPVAAAPAPAPVAAAVTEVETVPAIEPPPIEPDQPESALAAAAAPAAAPAPPTDDTAPALPEDATVLAQAAPQEDQVASAKPEPPGEPAAAITLPPSQPPGSARLLYTVTGSARGISYNASGTLDWALTEHRYNARMEMRMLLLGSRVQTSTGQVGPQGLMPERFADKGRGSERAAHFEPDHRRIRFSANTPEAELLPGAQDRLSLFLQIAGLLQARPQAYASGQVIEMQVAGTGDAEIWRFQVGEESTLALPAGELRVRHLARQPRKAFDSTVEMWLAPELNHLPVRLRVTQANGDFADQQLSQKP